MKKLILFISLAILLASCQSSPTPQLTAIIEQTKTPDLPTVTSQELLEVAQATIASQNALKRSFSYIEPLKVIRAEKMNYEEYTIQINHSAGSNQPKDLKVWFFLYYNKGWKSKPPVADPSLFSGCVWVVINAENGMPVEVGGPLGIGIVNECDK